MAQWIQRQAKHSEILEKHLSWGKLSSLSMKCWRADTFRRKRGKNCKSNALCFFLPGLCCYLQLSKFSCLYLPDSEWLFYFFLCSIDFTPFEGWLTKGCVWSSVWVMTTVLVSQRDPKMGKVQLGQPGWCCHGQGWTWMGWTGCFIKSQDV